MNYLRAIGFKRTDGLPDDFPFTLPAIESLDKINFSVPVTFLVGENGSGKSTVLEAIAVGMQCPAIGRQDAEFDELLLPAKHLAKHLTFIKSRKPKRRMFFRAEDAMGFTLRARDNMQDLKEMGDHFDQALTGEGRTRAMGSVRGSVWHWRVAMARIRTADPTLSGLSICLTSGFWKTVCT